MLQLTNPRLKEILVFSYSVGITVKTIDVQAKFGPQQESI